MKHSDIIKLWPSLVDFSRETGIPYESVKQFKRRSLIPYWFWTAVIEAATARGFSGLSYEGLAEAASATKAKRQRRAAA